jgi:hypothetical protein
MKKRRHFLRTAGNFRPVFARMHFIFSMLAKAKSPITAKQLAGQWRKCNDRH